MHNIFIGVCQDLAVHRGGVVWSWGGLVPGGSGVWGGLLRSQTKSPHFGGVSPMFVWEVSNFSRHGHPNFFFFSFFFQFSPPQKFFWDAPPPRCCSMHGRSPHPTVNAFLNFNLNFLYCMKTGTTILVFHYFL